MLEKVRNVNNNWVFARKIFTFLYFILVVDNICTNHRPIATVRALTDSETV